jgi:hypothetical protein
MTRSRLSHLKLAVAGSALALGVAAAPALGADYNLSITGPSSATVGQPIVFQATGSNPATDFFSSWLDVYAIPASAVGTCPAGYLTASQLANTTGGETITNAQREDADSAGQFSMPFGYSPARSGRMLICGYTNDGATGTLATSFSSLDVQSSGSGGGGGGGGGNSPVLAKPANTAKPSLKRKGKKLVCRPGGWAGSPDGYAYGWRVNGKKKSGAHGQKLKISRGLRGRSVQCQVTAFNDAGATTAISRVLRVH